MAEKPKILIVDDEYNTREALVRYLKKRFEVTAAADGGEAIDLLRQRNFDLVLTDLRMPEADGMSVLDAARGKAERPQCILLTAYGSIGDAVKAVKHGAFDFVPKPVKLDKLEEVINAALASVREQSDGEPSGAVSGVGGIPVVFPSDPGDPMTRVIAKLCTVAPSRTTVLLTGESGTGKEVLARLLHERSGRSGLFVPVHCAALTSTLLESELFGYEKGAFTGAVERRRGRFELADGGTIFLDEVGEIDAATQVKLLRVLETRSFERVGGTETIRSDVRLVAATNRNLKRMVEAGTFREDLFYRLSVVNLELPPLRERKGEIPSLVNAFIKEFAAENGRDVQGVTPGAMERLLAYPWPGNIRELRNCIESMVVLSSGEWLDVGDLPESISAEPVPATAAVEGAEAAAVPAGSNAGVTLHDSERELIARTLARCNGNRTAAAKMLGISRRTLHRRLAEAKADGDPENSGDGGSGN